MLAGTYQIHVYCVLEILLTNHTRAVDNNVNSLKTFQDCFERFLDNVPFADVCQHQNDIRSPKSILELLDIFFVVANVQKNQILFEN